MHIHVCILVARSNFCIFKLKQIGCLRLSPTLITQMQDAFLVLYRATTKEKGGYLEIG
jgi:hypothetical protein